MNLSRSWFTLVLGVVAACGGEVAASGSGGGTSSGGPGGPPPGPAPTASDGKKPTDPPKPVSCPTPEGGVFEPAFLAKKPLASIEVGPRSFHLMSNTEVVVGEWSGSEHRQYGALTVPRGSYQLLKLSQTHWAVSEPFTDLETRAVTVYRDLTRVGSFEVPNGAFDRSNYREGMSPDGTMVVFNGLRGVMLARATAGADHWERGAAALCGEGCQLLGVDERGFVLSNQGNLESRTWADPKTVEARVTDTTGDRTLVGMTKSRVVFDMPFSENGPIVLDRQTLRAAVFDMESSEDIRAMRERSDGTFDVFTIFSGEVARARHVTATGAPLRSNPGHAAYGAMEPGLCGFWSEGRLFTYPQAR